MWQLEILEINGGFLPGLKLKLPPGLTCIIGPRGSGKSTLAELIRFALLGTAGSTKARTELLQANLGQSGLVSTTVIGPGSQRYVASRAYKQPAFVATEDGRAIDVDLDRGTFLPLDVFNSSEIEAIADEDLGDKRRALLDALRSDDLHAIQVSLGSHRRVLEANADNIRSARRQLHGLTERIEELAGVRARLSALSPTKEDTAATEYANEVRQQQANAQELANLETFRSELASKREILTSLLGEMVEQNFVELVDERSPNKTMLERAEGQIRKALQPLNIARDDIGRAVELAEKILGGTERQLKTVHNDQAVRLAKLSEKAQAASAAIRERTILEQHLHELAELEASRLKLSTRIDQLLEERKAAKGAYLSERENVSALRQDVAEQLQRETGTKVRIRVMRNADDLAYRQNLLDGLKGARVRNHDEILDSLLRLRPEELAQLIDRGDVTLFDEQMSFGSERAGKIMSALRENIDPLALELTTIEDRVLIELNVSPEGEPHFRDAAELSQGQKCTALLPLLLARRDNPIVIDQPEDNLDNHFIYETIVDAISRLKSRRQMILITHNANIPVLAEAELVVVLNSDGKIGFIEKAGNIDECRDEIIDLLEGGEKAFALRSKRYARRK
jgi:energy-coupling factor transporter ATP-binding protein EcfA2